VSIILLYGTALTHQPSRSELLNDPAVFERFSPHVFTSVDQPLQSVGIHKGIGHEVVKNVPLLVNDKGKSDACHVVFTDAKSAFDFVTPVTMYLIANLSTEGGLNKAKEAVNFLVC